MKDPIIDEIHAYRREQAEKFQFNLEAMVADLKKREAMHPHKIKSVRLKPRKLKIPESQTAISTE